MLLFMHLTTYMAVQPAKDEVLAWFNSGAIDVLLATTALAVGVNLPVRCVVSVRAS